MILGLSHPFKKLAWVCLLLFVSLLSAKAQTPSPTVTPDVAATPTPVVERTPMEKLESEWLTTPEASLQRFLDLMSQAGPLRPDVYLLARRHLDLSQIARLVRGEAGVTLCQQLYAILGSIPLDFERIKTESNTGEIVLYRQPSGDELVLTRDEQQHWRFSAETVQVIPQMYRVLTGKGKIQQWGFASLNFEIGGMNANIWLALLLLPCFAYLVGAFAILVGRVSFGRLLLRMGIVGPEQKFVLRPLGWLMASCVLWVGISALELPSWLLVVLTASVKILASLSAVVAAFRLSDAMSFWLTSFTARTASRFDDMLVPLARRTFKGLVGFLGLLFLAQNLDIEVWSLFAGFSIFGAMVALAGQDLVKNLFGSVTVLIDQPFAIGDWVVIEGIEGTVEDVGFRSTRIRTFYDSVVSVPNSRLITAAVDNYGRRKFRRYTKKLPVRWSTPPDVLEAFCEGIREIVRRHPLTRKDYYQIWVNDINEYAMEILLYVFFAAPDWSIELRERHRFLLDVHRLGAQLGIELAYPSQRLLFQEEPECDPNAPSEGELEAQERGRQACDRILRRSEP